MARKESGREAGRNYLMLEGTDAQIHLIYYTPEMAEARSRGGLRPNSFIRVQKRFAEKKPVLQIEDLGDAEALLHNRGYLKQSARHLMRRGVIPEEDGWRGWLAAIRMPSKRWLWKNSIGSSERTKPTRFRNAVDNSPAYPKIDRPRYSRLTSRLLYRFNCS